MGRSMTRGRGGGPTFPSSNALISSNWRERDSGKREASSGPESATTRATADTASSLVSRSMHRETDKRHTIATRPHHTVMLPHAAATGKRLKTY